MRCIYCGKIIVVDAHKPGPKPSKYCSRSHKLNHRIVLFRKKVKLKAVEYLGGKCTKCGYSKCLRALQFHHRDPKQKKFGIAQSSVKAWSVVKEELDKCDLLCSNCHVEEEERLLASSKIGLAFRC